jgi:Flp pilus assembly protein TadD
MLKRNVGALGLPLVFFLLLVVVRVSAQSLPGGGTSSADAGWGGGGLSGMVLSSTGERFSRHISVRIRSMDKGDRVTTTDDKGNFVFTGVPRGDYVVIIDKEKDFEPYSENVTILAATAGPHLIIRLRLKGEAKSETGVINSEFANVPQNALASYHKAVQSAQAGNNKAAIEQLKQAISEYPNFMLAYNELGVQYRQLNDLNKADEALRSALKLSPEAATPLLNHGIVLALMGKFDLAVNDLQGSLKQKDQSAIGHFYLGQALANLGRFGDAEQHLARAVALGGDEMKDAHRFLGIIYLQRGERERAVIELETYLRLAPKAKDADQVRQIISQAQKPRN